MSEDTSPPATAPQKCVLIINEDLPLGVIANTAAVLSLSLGKQAPELVGDDLFDRDGHRHHGITTVAIPVLKCRGTQMSTMREAMKAHEPELTVIDLAGITRSTRSYGEYTEQFGRLPADALDYQGFALRGPAKLVNKFAGSLGLLR